MIYIYIYIYILLTSIFMCMCKDKLDINQLIKLQLDSKLFYSLYCI